MHPLDTLDRHALVKDAFKIGYCNITKCCTEVCPEHIQITDNGIIPLKERVADDHYDPVRWVLRKIGGPAKDRAKLPVLQPVVDSGDRQAMANPPNASATSKQKPG
jgi:succinate dehydrogenase / fumarate reductase iron-sulfur subunit